MGCGVSGLDTCVYVETAVALDGMGGPRTSGRVWGALWSCGLRLARLEMRFGLHAFGRGVFLGGGFTGLFVSLV